MHNDLLINSQSNTLTDVHGVLCLLFIFSYAIQESKLCKLMSRQTLITKNATKWNKIILTMTTKSTPAWTNISRRCRSSSWVLMAAPTNNCFLHNTRTHSTCMIMNHTQIETSLNHTQTHSVLDHILHAHAKYYTKHTQDTLRIRPHTACTRQVLHQTHTDTLRIRPHTACTRQVLHQTHTRHIRQYTQTDSIMPHRRTR